MASAFAHVAVPAVLYVAFKSKAINFRLFLLAAALSILPDLDVIGFKLGIPYASQWGHRGFTHSFAFAAVIAAVCVVFKNKLHSRPLPIFLVSFVACASHAVLDAMTNGGLGVAFFWPIHNERIFFPFRPIQVSPIGISKFFTERGLRVITSELIWVFIPALMFGLIALGLRRKHSKQPTNSPQ